MKKENLEKLKKLTRRIQKEEGYGRIVMDWGYLTAGCGCIGAHIAHEFTGENKGHEVGERLLKDLLGVSGAFFYDVLDKFTDFDTTADGFFDEGPWTTASYGEVMHQLTEAYASGGIDRLVKKNTTRIDW